MKCNKCGTPIIPGENACRICGNTNFSERIKEPEVIDFPDLDLEDKKEEKVNSLPDLMDIIDIEEPKKEIAEEEKIELEEEITREPELVSDEIKDTAISKQVVEPTVEEQKKENTKSEIKEEKNDKKEKTKKVIEVEETKSSKKKVLDKVNEKEEKTKKEFKEPKIKTKNKSSDKSGIVLLTILLLCSIGLNIFLFAKDGENVTVGETPEIEGTYSKVSYNKHKITMPSNWITENTNNNLLIYDDTQNWSASMKLVNDSSYEAFAVNTEELTKALGSLKYQFTSNYSKSLNNKEFHLFKGKYYDYSVFVIVTELDEDSLVVVDLKFKGEVDDILLNNILTSMTSVKENNTEELFKDNFEFVDITEQIKSVSKKIEVASE